MEENVIEGFGLEDVVNKLAVRRLGHPEMLESERNKIVGLFRGTELLPGREEVAGEDGKPLHLHIHAVDTCLLPVPVGKWSLDFWCPHGPSPREISSLPLGGKSGAVNGNKEAGSVTGAKS